MESKRLEAFSDGVIAIIITIMVLELKVPHGADLSVLEPLLPVFLCYLLSFVYVGIYWNNHHHMLHATKSITGGILWANLNLLFWLSLFPFATGWMGENHFRPVPTAAYGAVLLITALSWTILQRSIIRHLGRDSLLARAVGKDTKGKVSPLLYLVGIALSLFEPWLGCALYVAVAMMWLVPSRRIEEKVAR
jgi:uncharacterized membrane protein